MGLGFIFCDVIGSDAANILRMDKAGISNHRPNVLKPEVQPPFKPSNGLGILFVAGASMFFAVASSAFIVRASLERNANRALYQSASMMMHSTPTSTIVQHTPEDCGKAVLHTRHDGSTAVVYRICR